MQTQPSSGGKKNKLWGGVCYGLTLEVIDLDHDAPISDPTFKIESTNLHFQLCFPAT